MRVFSAFVLAPLLAQGALIMKSWSYAQVKASVMVEEFDGPCGPRSIKFGEAGDLDELARAMLAECGGHAAASSSSDSDGVETAALAARLAEAIEAKIHYGQGPEEVDGDDGGDGGKSQGQSQSLNPWSDPIQDCIDAGIFCGTGGCFETDASLFSDLRDIVKARHRELITLHATANNVRRELLNSPTEELTDAVQQTLELFRSETRPDASKPWATYPVRMVTGETLKFLEYHAGETATNGMDYTALANRLRWRAAFRVKIWTDPLQSPDTFNTELWGIRPENHVPFPPRGTWPYCDSALDALEANWEGLFDEYKALNNGNLLHGKHLEEHEQGLQLYTYNTSMWFRSTFWRAGTCRNGAFKFSCALFQKLQDAWKPCVPLARSP
jgi:hypothetical protein